MTNEEKIRRELARVLTSLNNYPHEAQGQLWGRDLSKVIDKATEAVMGSGVVEIPDVMFMRPEVTRVEVIDGFGRAYVNWTNPHVSEVMTALQDGGKTLKIFVNGKEEPDGT